MLEGIANPLLPADVPDPCLVPVDDGFLLVGTSFFDDVEDKFPLFHTTDLRRFEPRGHVFPRGRAPRWAVGQFWAPEIHRAAGGWTCTYTARDTTGRLCIGVARAERADGPYHDLGGPLLRDPRVGLIDAHRFVDDDGRAYLFWKVDGNDLRPQEPTPILVQEIGPDGVSLVGERRGASAITNDLPWEAHVVEGPWAVRRGEHVYLFYSGCVVRVGQEDLYVHHAWDGEAVFGRHPRIPLVARIVWRGGWPSLEPFPDRVV